MESLVDSKELLINVSEEDGGRGEPIARKQSRFFSSMFSGKLSTIPGVTIPCCLSIFSVIIFLRLGYVVGMAGLEASLGMLCLGYFTVTVTVLSLSAISTNGAIKGGGAYFMISRALGPEFGGSVGIIFYVANVFASAMNVIGLVESLVDNFDQLPDGNEWRYLYGTVTIVLCLIICLVGASTFAMASILIFVLVMAAIISVIVSFAIKHSLLVSIVPEFRHYNATHSPGLYCPVVNGTHEQCEAYYTGWNETTLHQNLKQDYVVDYSTQVATSFQIVFSVLFNGCTGIMAGANMSGDLKNPSFSIPFGTLGACLFTFSIYALLMILSGFTCSRALLQNNYNFLLYINVWHPFIIIGVLSSTLSAALSCLIGASRILQAVAKDNLFGVILRIFAKMKGTKRNNPVYALLFSWILVQLILIIGKLNAVAPYVAMFFLLSYSIVNIACLALTSASAPNFRPTFKYYSWHTALLGAVACIGVMFYTSPTAAGVSIGVMTVLYVLLAFFGPTTSWGEASQALIYHQVRKYLLRLDMKKEHVKLWRPQMLYLVANPRSSLQAMDFINDLKKGGLYILGHVDVNAFEKSAKRHKKNMDTWVDFVQCTKLKAFVEWVSASSVRTGAQSLMMASGLGGMRPNTVVLGFFGENLPQTTPRSIWKKSNPLFRCCTEEEETKIEKVVSQLQPSAYEMKPLEYVGIIRDSLLLEMNVCVLRNFEKLDKTSLKCGTIDVWPLYEVDFEGDDEEDGGDPTGLLLLQLGWILHKVHDWKNGTQLRVMILSDRDYESVKGQVSKMMKLLRIPAEICIVPYRGGSVRGTPEVPTSFLETGMQKNLNLLMKKHSACAKVIFSPLARPPDEDEESLDYLESLQTLTADLPPIVLVHGIQRVVTTVF